MAVSVPHASVDEARQLFIGRATMGPALIEDVDGPYEKPRRYGVFAIWFMLLDYIFHIPSLILGGFFGGIILLIAPYIHQSWWTPSDANDGGSWSPEIRMGGHYPTTNTTLEPEGLLFLVFLLSLSSWPTD